MKKLLVLFLIVFLLGCSKTASPINETPFRKAQNGKPIYLVHTNRQHPVVRIMMAGFLQACADYGLDCKDAGVDQEDLPGEIAKIEQINALGASGVITTIHDKSEYLPVHGLIYKNIPVINGHFPIVEGDVPGLLAWSAPDNVGYANSAALAMADKIQCKGKVSVTQGGLNDGENAVAKSFTETLHSKCPDLPVMDVQIEGYDAAGAEAATTAIIQANPDLTGAFSTTGGGAKAWANGLKASGKASGEIAVIGMDYSRENLDLVKSGDVYMLVGQPLFEEFYYAVQMMVTNLMGYPIPYANTLPAPLITKDNVDKYYKINDLAESVQIK